jgi:alpha-tubulin suppressor-like RCC1 family protein
MSTQTHLPIAILRVIAALGLAACVEQPLFPRVGVATLDDPQTGNYSAVSAGFEHTCALTSDGTAFCWGSNEYEQLGVAADTICLQDDRRIPCRLRPAPVSGGLKFLKISAGGRHTCGIATDGRTYCWGDNLEGGLGDPFVRSSPTPIPIVGTMSFREIAAGRQHTCGLRVDGFVFCWGANEFGQVGNSTAGFAAPAPDSVRTNNRFASLVAGAQKTCARTGDGATFCWGETWFASLNGDEFTRAQTTPLRVPNAPPFKSIAVGTHTTCGISTQTQTSAENASHCWESNTYGGIGDGSRIGNDDPQPVRGGHRFVAVASGAQHICAIADSGFAYCWGGGSLGQLGVSPFLLSSRCGPTILECVTSPVRVSGQRLFSQVSAGQGSHTCGLTVNGNVYCWGAGKMGQRGDGKTTSGEWSPVQTAPPTLQ